MHQTIASCEVRSPFGYPARLIQSKLTDTIAALYQLKCGVDVSRFFRQVGDCIHLYQCAGTGYMFWRPETITGDEEFYRSVSTAWPNYYRVSRWEHSHARKHLESYKSVLEIGCGPGHFLRSLEGIVPDAVGLELNRTAIANKVTRFPVHRMTIEDFAADGTMFDAVYAFQVLEHVPDPYSLIRASMECVVPGGILMFSVPNNQHGRYARQEDAFDLPPHHVGHFTPNICRKIARHFGLEVSRIHVQSSIFSPPKASARTMSRFPYRACRIASVAIMSACYALLKEPGENLLMIFRKKGDASA